LDVLRGGPEPCLILLDLWMPVKTGWGFRIEQMRDARLARIPTVVLSADDARRDMTGVAATLPKPLDFDRLFDIVRRHCTRPAARRTNGDEPGVQAPVFDWLPTWVFDEIVRLARDVGTTVVGLEARCDELIFTLSTGATVRRVLATHSALHEPTAHVG
jgi:CheY-like chemotaxis protein